MPCGQHEPVSVEPRRVAGVVPQVPGPESVGHRRSSEGHSRMAAGGFLHGVDREPSDSIDGERGEFGRGVMHVVEST